MHLRRRMLSALAVALVPGALGAQTVPAVTVDLAAGSGAHPAHAGARWFLEDQREPVAHGALGIRLGGPGRVRPVAVLDYSFDVRDADVVAICVLAPDGSCRESFPSTTGAAAALGVRIAVTDRLLAGVLAGVGRYDGPTRFAGVDLSARVFRRVGVLVAFRHVVIADPESPRTWFRPLTFGVRLQP